MTDDELATLLFRVASCVQYRHSISNLHDCNDCGKRTDCEYLPPLGYYTRINCPLWEGKEKNGKG